MGGNLYYGLLSCVSQLSKRAVLYGGLTAGLHISHAVNSLGLCLICICETKGGKFRFPEAMLVKLQVRQQLR